MLLLYRDLEDFLERQAIETIEVDGLDDGVEVAELEWGRGEAALAMRPAVHVQRAWRAPAMTAGALAVASVAAAVTLVTLTGPVSSPVATDVPPGLRGPSAPIPAARPLARLPAPEAEPPPQQADLLDPGQARPGWSTTLTVVVAILWASAGLGMIFSARRRPRRSWLRSEAGAPLTVGESRRRRWNVITRALLHPIDFLVARGWSLKASGRPLAASASASIKGYREFAPEEPIRSGVRLDLDRIELGFVDLTGHAGDARDGRFLLRRQGRVLLNRNHPTVRDLITIAASEPGRARVLLDMLLATDAELGRGTDPRQVEWDLLGRAETILRKEAS